MAKGRLSNLERFGETTKITTVSLKTSLIKKIESLYRVTNRTKTELFNDLVEAGLDKYRGILTKAANEFEKTVLASIRADKLLFDAYNLNKDKDPGSEMEFPPGFVKDPVKVAILLEAISNHKRNDLLSFITIGTDGKDKVEDNQIYKVPVAARLPVYGVQTNRDHG